MIDILTFIPGKKKKTGSGWISFNAPCCSHRGHAADQRGRGGVKLTDANWSFHCFNCGFKCSFVLGRPLAARCRQLLTWLQVPLEEIERMNLESLRHRSIDSLIATKTKHISQSVPRFDVEVELPENATVITDQDLEYKQYLQQRHVPAWYPCLKMHNDLGKKEILVPFTFNQRIVGWSSRKIVGAGPKYIMQSPNGYVFGTDLQKSNWHYVIVVEGVFDALSIGGVAVLHNTVNDVQAKLIRSLGREVVVVPDQDKAGMQLVQQALEHNWAVSIPEWPQGCKDVNDAVRCLGKLNTLISIMQHKQNNKLKIELKRKKIAKQS